MTRLEELMDQRARYEGFLEEIQWDLEQERDRLIKSVNIETLDNDDRVFTAADGRQIYVSDASVARQEIWQYADGKKGELIVGSITMNTKLLMIQFAENKI